MKKFIAESTARKYQSNIIEIALKIVGAIVIVVGIIAGFIIANDVPGEYGFVWSVALAYWGVSVISGLLILGLSEVINLLQQLVVQSRTYSITEKEN